MMRPLSTVWRANPEALADEILAIYRGACHLLNAPDNFGHYRPVPEFFSLPQFPELVAAAHVALEGMGRDVEGVDMIKAKEIALSLPRRCEPDRTELRPPLSEEELSALLDQVTDRLDAVAWESEALKRLGAWCDDNPDKGMQVCAALRLVAGWCSSNFYAGRD